MDILMVSQNVSGCRSFPPQTPELGSLPFMNKRLGLCCLILGFAAFFGLAPTGLRADEVAKKKLVLIAGRKSHAYGQHAFKAGCLLLKNCLEKSNPNIQTVVVLDGWPKDTTPPQAPQHLFMTPHATRVQRISVAPTPRASAC